MLSSFVFFGCLAWLYAYKYRIPHLDDKCTRLSIMLFLDNILADCHFHITFPLHFCLIGILFDCEVSCYSSGSMVF